MNVRLGILFLFSYIFLNVCAITSTTCFGQVSSFENIDQSSQKGFYKDHIKGFFSDFTHFGDPFTLMGGIGLNMRSYNAFGGPLRQDPFFYSVNANISCKIYQIELPFSMVITAKNVDSSQPSWSEIKNAFKDRASSYKNRFMRLGISPHYKWAKLHLGHRSMNFSNYTLHNLNFNGFGFELTPGKLRISGMYGQTAKAEPVDLSLTTPNIPVYQRIGMGIKIGYGDDISSFDLIMFKAKDKSESIIIPDTLSIQPTAQENVVLGLNAQKLLLNRFRIKVEYAHSILSPNAQDAISSDRKLTSFLIENRNTTTYNSALDASIAYEGSLLNAGLQYKRIDPNFKTFGAYFFNTDIIDILGNVGFGLFNNTVNLALSAGTQTNNLDNVKPSTTKRFIYAINSSFTKGSLSINANYNNNTTDVAYILNTNIDSLNAVFVTQDMGVNISYSLKSESKLLQTFTLSGNKQKVNDDLVNRVESAQSDLLSANFGYIVTFPSKVKISSRLIYNQNQISDIIIKRYGMGAGISKSFIKGKLQLGLDATYFMNKRNNLIGSNNLLGKLSAGFQIFNGMNINIQWGLLRTTSEALLPFTESTGIIGLAYNFQYKPVAKSSK